MKISVLVENTSECDSFSCEHGISLYIETENVRILFDTGQSEAFAGNAVKAGIHLENTDFAVLSHGHYDHGGGLPRFLAINHKAPVFLHKDAFGQHYNKEKYIGLDPAIRKSDRLVFTDGTFPVRENITLCTIDNSLLRYPIEPHGLSVKIQDKTFPEDFRHEQYLIIEENGKKILFSGCSHKGIINIISFFRPDIMIGGLHFKDIPIDKDGCIRLQQYAQCLASYPIQYYVGHCTGKAQYEYIQPFFHGNISYIRTGTVIYI